MYKITIFLLLIVGFVPTSQADDLRYIFEFGGTVSSGDTFPGSNLKAGDSVCLSAGLSIPVWKNNFIQATAGYLTNNDSSVTYSDSFDAKTIDLQASHIFAKKHQLGIGATYHISPTLTCGGPTTCSDTIFDNSLGYIVEYSYIFDGYKSGSSGIIGVKYSSIEYTGPYTINASNTLLMLGFRF